MAKKTTDAAPRGKTLAQVFAAEADTVQNLGDLVPDPKNARKHNPKNIGMISDSLRAVGAGRSILIDEHNEIIAGNGVVEAAAEAGILRVRVVEADGNELIAVRRRNLTDEQKRKLAIYDNRTAELAEWDTDVLREFQAQGMDFAPFEFDLVREGLDEHTRPDVSSVLDTFTQQRGQTDKNEQWFYVEFYGDAERFASLQARLRAIGALKGEHEVFPEVFATAIEATCVPKDQDDDAAALP